MVEKKPRLRSLSRREVSPYQLSSAELDARLKALELERERQQVVRSLQARGEAVNPSISIHDLRKGYSVDEWRDLVAEGQRGTLKS